MASVSDRAELAREHTPIPTADRLPINRHAQQQLRSFKERRNSSCEDHKSAGRSAPGFRGDTQKRGHQANLRTELNRGIERTLLEQTKRIARILAR